MKDQVRYLFFSMGPEDFGIPLLSVKEVIAMPELTPVPQSPAYFLGLMNLRGQVLSVVDLRKKLSLNSAKNEDLSVIILDFGDLQLGVVVDEVKSVQLVDESDISTSSVIDNSKNYEYIIGVYQGDEGLTLLLNVEKALSLEDKSRIQSEKRAA